MTRLFNNPESFAEEMIEGFTAASARWVHPVSGGVIRATRAEEPTVAVVIGGGSGHYPAFGGYVGPGIAHGAAMGNLFASPSAQQVHSVARAADAGRGVLLTFGNYAGDVLHFGQAQERMRKDGIDCRTVLVTDDVWSAPKGELDKRRGIAGDLVVFKIAGAAAEAGYDLDGVERTARLANDRTRSFGVAFGGCTLPGADEPLFTVPEGKMAIGLGIHGEPGIDEIDLPTAAELARIFVEKLLDELPDGVALPGARVVPILNGLGTVKYEELFVVYREIHALLEQAGVVVLAPEVGEFCTSFDMAGASLTLFWPDDELEGLWAAPCDTPAYRRGAVDGHARRTDAPVTASDEVVAIGDASAESQQAAALIARALEAMARMLDEQAEELGRIDRIAGDGDHGIGMQRGSRAATAAADAAVIAGAGARTTLHRAGEAWADKGGGTSGAIWGVILETLGDALHDDRRVGLVEISAGVAGIADAVMAFGKARPGDKTMVDAIVPFAEVFPERIAAGDNLIQAWTSATQAADAAARATAEMTARLGRARAHGGKSHGTADPGAVSFALVADTVLGILKAE